jgi:cytochrome c biogenesis protein
MASGRSSSRTTGGLACPSEASEISAAAPVVDDNSVADEKAEFASESSARARKASAASNLVSRSLSVLSSVPFGIVLLILLIITHGIGNIHHTKYLNLMLALLSLNIINFILASIKHLQAAWSYIVGKEITASPASAMAQDFKDKIELPILGREQLVERAATAARAMKLNIRITLEETRTTIFAERGVWNRLGAYAVHVGLLTIFSSGFLNNYRGYTGGMWIEPEKRSDKIAPQVFNVENSTTQHAAGLVELQLPFTVEGLDIQQKLIDKNRPSDANNTLDWITRVRIHDHETGQQTEALVQMNNPFDYRGYRVFQASFTPSGSARTIKLKITPTSGGASEEVTIGRNGKVNISDGTQLHYFEFNPSFTVNANQETGVTSSDYVNPAAHLAYLKPGGEQGEMWAFTEGFINEISNKPNFQSKFLDASPYRLVLTDFEKVPYAHMLWIQYHPGTKLMYTGVTILCLALIGVFFFSHQRLWIVVEDGTVYLGGNSNRNQLGFEDCAKKVVALIREPWTAEHRTSFDTAF